MVASSDSWWLFRVSLGLLWSSLWFLWTSLGEQKHANLQTCTHTSAHERTQKIPMQVRRRPGGMRAPVFLCNLKELGTFANTPYTPNYANKIQHGGPPPQGGGAPYLNAARIPPGRFFFGCWVACLVAWQQGQAEQQGSRAPEQQGSRAAGQQGQQGSRGSRAAGATGAAVAAWQQGTRAPRHQASRAAWAAGAEGTT